MQRVIVSVSKFLAFVTVLAIIGNVLADEPAGQPNSEPLVIPADKATADPNGKIVWYDLRLLHIEGRGWKDTKSFYSRLPAKAEGVVRPPVWNLGTNSAGECARFITDASSIAARWKLSSPNLAMEHMPATGVSGLDLYVKDSGKWRWLATGKPKGVDSTAELVSTAPKGEHEYLLYLPLYNGVRSVELGLPIDAKLTQVKPDGQKPIVFYGTSITQGGCASRPGMAHPAILGRRLKVPIINLGFSGNGKMEIEMAKLLAELDPSIYVIDCLPNMADQEVAERAEPLVKTLRAAHPDTPILLVEDRTFANAFFHDDPQAHPRARREALRGAYDRLSKAGVTNLHYLPGENLLGADGEDTVDGSHPTDLGFVRMADVFEPVLNQLLAHGQQK